MHINTISARLAEYQYRLKKQSQQEIRESSTAARSCSVSFHFGGDKLNINHKTYLMKPLVSSTTTTRNHKKGTYTITTDQIYWRDP